VLAIASKRSPLAQYSTRSSMEHVAGKLYICIIYRKEWSLAIEQYTSRDNRSKQFSWCSSSPICKRAQAVQTGGVQQIQQTQHMENAGGSRSGSGRGATNDKCALFGWTRPRPRPAVEKGLLSTLVDPVDEKFTLSVSVCINGDSWCTVAPAKVKVTPKSCERDYPSAGGTSPLAPRVTH
jgi:hypothetical protein